MYITIEKVRNMFKNRTSSFKNGYFDAFNNPNRTRKDLEIKKIKINELLINGNLIEKQADFFEGQKLGLKDCGMTWNKTMEVVKMGERNCVYGSEHTQDVCFVSDGWYCIKGSVNVNRTYDEINDGVDVETLTDYDCMTAQEPINSIEEFEKFLEE